MARLAVACAALLLLACEAPPPPASGPPPAVPPPTASQPAPQDPRDIPVSPAIRTESHTIDGRTFLLTLAVPAVAMVHEPVEALLSIAGSDLEVEVAYMGRNALGRPENYRVTVRGPGGDLPGRDAGPQFGGQTWTVLLTPERGHRQKFLLPSWVAGDLAPGPHSVRVETDLRVRIPDGVWRDTRIGIDVPFEIVADDPARLARVIQRFGDDAVGDDFDRSETAMRHLAVMHGPDVVTQWLRIAGLPAYTARQAAARALAASTEDRALAAVVRIAATRAADLPAAAYTTEALREQSAGQLRLTCAQALADSPHPRALDELLAMKADPDQGVRLTVLHRVARIPGAEALPMLRAFAADADRLVAQEARRYLGERR